MVTTQLAIEKFFTISNFSGDHVVDIFIVHTLAVTEIVFKETTCMIIVTVYIMSREFQLSKFVTSMQTTFYKCITSENNKKLTV